MTEFEQDGFAAEGSLMHNETSWVWDDSAHRNVVAVCLAVIFVLGIFGNALVILAVALSRKLQTVANVFVVNLTFAGFIACTTLPLTIANLVYNQTTSILPARLCTCQSFMSYISFSGTIISHALISFDRLFKITQPVHKYKEFFSPTRVIVIISLAWMYSCLSVFIALIVNVSFGYSLKYRVCTPDIMDKKTGYVSLFRAVTVDLLSFIIIVFCYSWIFRHIYRNNRELLNLFSLQSIRQTLSNITPKSSLRKRNKDNTQELQDIKKHSAAVKRKLYALDSMGKTISQETTPHFERRLADRRGVSDSKVSLSANSSPCIVRKERNDRPSKMTITSEITVTSENNSQTNISDLTPVKVQLESSAHHNIDTNLDNRDVVHAEQSLYNKSSVSNIDLTLSLDEISVFGNVDKQIGNEKQRHEEYLPDGDFIRKMDTSDVRINGAGEQVRNNAVSSFPQVVPQTSISATQISNDKDNGVSVQGTKWQSAAEKRDKFKQKRTSTGLSKIRSLSLGINIPYISRANKVSTASTSSSSAVKSALFARQVSITKNMFLVVIVFFVCITPYSVCLSVESFEQLFPYIAVLFSFSNCINPVIYGMKHPQFRSVFIPLLKFKLSQIPDPSKLLKIFVKRKSTFQ